MRQDGPGLMSQGDPATVIVATETDLASRNLRDGLVETQGFRSTGINLLGKPVYQKDSLLLATFEGMIVSPPPLDEYFYPVAYVFLSRHSAESGIPSLTAHTTGNFSSEARFGGMPRELGRADPSLLKGYLMSLKQIRDRVPRYQITLEATHHGPTSLQKPILFVELGSSEPEWGDKKAAQVVGEALVSSLSNRRIWSNVALGFGGTHYPDKFTRLSLEEDVAFSYIVPKYSLEHLDEMMFGQMLQRTNAPVTKVYLDWKGLGANKGKVLSLASQFGLEVVRV